MFLNLALKKFLAISAAVPLSLMVCLAPANAADLVVTINASTQVSGTVTLKYTNGTSTASAPLWSGNVPTSIQAVYDKYQTCQYLKFPIQAALPYQTMREDVTVKFDIWTAAGEKVASDSVSYSEWNPLDGPTMVSWLECGDWLSVGTQNIVITTEQTLSTNGLLSRYVSGTQTFPFTIAAVTPPTTVPPTTLAPATTVAPVLTIPLVAATVPPVTVPAKVITPKKVKKITCVKGKKIKITTKKVCPAGYKKRK